MKMSSFQCDNKGKRFSVVRHRRNDGDGAKVNKDLKQTKKNQTKMQDRHI